MNPPNEAFVEALIKVRIIRQLQGDEVGVRAYSTSIATVSAYPHKLQNTHGESHIAKQYCTAKHPIEVERLPGCGAKIAELWREWNETGELTEVRKADADPMVSVLRLFYNIWGVGDTTAREFYRKGQCPRYSS
jgi:DNA polymerase/3'-5' exonuclease PolX